MTDYFLISGLASVDQTFEASDTEKSFTLIKAPDPNDKNDSITQIQVQIPNWTNDVTLSLSILYNTFTIFSETDLSRNTTYNLPLDGSDLSVLATNELTVTLTLSGVPGGSGGQVSLLFQSQENLDSTGSGEADSIVTALSQTQATVDLVDVASDPSEIDCSSLNVVSVEIYVKDEFQWTLASSQTEANTRISSNSTRGIYPSGVWEFPVYNKNLKLYIRGTGSSTISDGLTYRFKETN